MKWLYFYNKIMCFTRKLFIDRICIGLKLVTWITEKTILFEKAFSHEYCYYGLSEVLSIFILF